jgi:outer membrane protein insertion porin family
MRKLITAILFVYLPLTLFSAEVLEKIEIVGNEKITRETILYYLSSREGGDYDEELLRRDFRVLWSTGFFSNIKIESEEGKEGKIVRIVVEENPLVKEIVYKTGKRLKKDDIVDKLKEKEEYVLPYSYYSPYKIHRIKQTIKELLLEKGLTDGNIDVNLNKIGKNELEVAFQIKEGSRIKVGEIVFEGSPKLRESVLNGAMKDNKEHGLISAIAGKDTFNQNKLDEDLSSLKSKLQEKGYMEATVGEPRIEEITKRSIFLKKKKMKKIIIPVQAGERYSVGEIKIEGNKLISSDYLNSLIKLREGDIYSTKAREKAVEKIGELYQNIGYLYAQVMPVENLDPKKKRVNVTFNIYESEAAYLHRLEFKGNTYTKDKVIRREVLLREGDRFSLELFKNSILRLRQLGLVELEKEPEIMPNPEDPTQIDVAVNVKELQRNNIQFSAGYSGYEGTYVSLSYSTVNFLGAGENLELMAQYGKRIKNYLFGFNEPYFLDLPISLGFQIYNRYLYYTGLYIQKSRGVNFSFGARIKGFWRTSITYGFEYLDIGPVEAEDEASSYVYNPYYYGSSYGYGNYFVGSLSPVIYRTTVDSPLTPSRGTMYLVGCKLAGGIMGGEISLIKPQFEWKFFHPIIKNHVIGLHLEYQFIKPLGNSDVPFWERFYLGGERSIRGYDIYSIGPRSDKGVNQGGQKSIVFNAEYIIPVGGVLYPILFWDVGNAYAEDENVSLKNLYSSTGLEIRVFVPALRVPFRLIFAYNSRKIYKDDSSFAFRFAIGTTF